MIPFDLASQVTVGAVMALAHREELAKSAEPLHSKAFRRGALFCGLLYIPSVQFFHHQWASWNAMYFVDPESSRRIGAWLGFGEAVVLFALFMAGFLWTAKLLGPKGDRWKPVLLRLGVIWAVVAAFIVGFWDRSFSSAPYAEWAANRPPMWEVRWGEPGAFWGAPIMWWILIFAPIDYGPLVWLYFKGRREATAAPSATS